MLNQHTQTGKQYLNGFGLIIEYSKIMYRIGKKQRRALLDESGHLVALFEKGQEELAVLTCELLNNQELRPSVKSEDLERIDRDRTLYKGRSYVAEYVSKNGHKLTSLKNRT